MRETANRRMRILYGGDVSIARIIGGSERVTYEETTRLARRGHTVHILSRDFYPDRPSEEVIQGVTEYRYRCSHEGGLKFMTRAILGGRKLFEHLDGLHHYDLLHLTHPITALAVTLSPASRGRPIIRTFLSPMDEEYRERFRGLVPGWRLAVECVARRWVERFALSKSGAIRVLSSFSKDQLERIHPKVDRTITVVPGGVAIERFQPVADRNALKRYLGVDPSRFLILTVRNLVPRMGLDRFLEAVAKARQTLPEIYVLIGGEGYLRNELEKQIGTLSLGDHVRLVGYIPDADLPRYYQAADLFVLPTASLEGFGLIMLESLACGTPVLGTPVGAIPEILERVDRSLVLPSANVEAMAAGICDFRKRMDGGHQQFRSRCAEVAASTYSWESIVERLETIMSDLIDQRTKRGD